MLEGPAKVFYSYDHDCILYLFPNGLFYNTETKDWLSFDESDDLYLKNFGQQLNGRVGRC